MRGKGIIHALVGNRGEAEDRDNDGLDEIPTEIVEMELGGESSLGPITLRLQDPTKVPFAQTSGTMEESANSTPGLLEVSPFVNHGNVELNSFFDVYFEIEIEGEIFKNSKPMRMGGTLRQFPSLPGAVYTSDEHVMVVNSSGASFENRVKIARWIQIPLTCTACSRL